MIENKEIIKKLEERIAELRKKLDNHEERVSRLEKIMKKELKTSLPRKKGTTEDYLIELKKEGFFTEGKTITQILEALHAKGKIVELTDLPPYLLKLVRNGILKRKRELIGKKKMWVYFV